MVHMKNGREVYPSSMGLESFKVTMGTEIGVDEYSSSKTYAVGDYCIYTNTIYKCKTAITTPEAFNSSKWDATSIANELMSTKQSLSNLGGNGYTAPSSFDPHVSHVSGGYCKIGKIVIVNLRISASQTISAGALLVNGLPTPNSTQNIVSVTNNRKADMTLNSQGSIGTADQLSSGNIILSCSYVCS